DVGIGAGRDVAVVGDDIVIGGDVIAVLRPNAGPAGVADNVAVESHRGVSPTEKTIKSRPLAVQRQSDELHIGSGRGGNRTYVNHRRGGETARPHQEHIAIAIILIGDPGRGAATV